MMLGIAASSSIVVPSGRFSQGGHSSVMNSAIPNATGIADQHRDRRGHERAVDRRQRAEFLGDRVPRSVDEKAEAEMPQRRQRAGDQRNDDAAEDQQHEQPRKQRSAPRNIVSPGGPRAPLLSRCAFDRDVCRHDLLLRRCSCRTWEAGEPSRVATGCQEPWPVHTGLPSGPTICFPALLDHADHAAGIGT